MTNEELLQQCRDEYAQKYRSHDYTNGFKDWKELEIHIQSVTIWTICMNESAVLAIQRAREEAAPKWTKLGEGTPTKSVCLVRIKSRRGVVLTVIGWWHGSIFTFDEDNEKFVVTHWMPLPDQPIEN